MKSFWGTTTKHTCFRLLSFPGLTYQGTALSVELSIGIQKSASPAVSLHCVNGKAAGGAVINEMVLCSFTFKEPKAVLFPVATLIGIHERIQKSCGKELVNS